MESAENREEPIRVNRAEQKLSDSTSLSKTETLRLLNDSIDRLKQTIEKINDNSASSLPPSDSINTLLTTTGKLADAVAASVVPKPLPVAPETSLTEATTSVPTQVKNQQQSPTIKTPSTKEKQTVTKVQKKKNLGLIVIGVTAIAIAIVTVFWLWLPSQQATVSSTSTSEPSVTELITESDNRARSALETPIINPDYSNDSDEIAVEMPADTEPISEEPLERLIPQDLESPGRAKNLKILTIEPELNFTPEQTLIAALPTKITELTKDYAELINSIEVDLPKSSLLVKVTDDWYQLNETRQNNLANQMLERSRKLDFSKLELKDPTGKLVARNPVIGDGIIIIQSDRS